MICSWQKMVSTITSIQGEIFSALDLDHPNIPCEKGGGEKGLTPSQNWTC